MHCHIEILGLVEISQNIDFSDNLYIAKQIKSKYEKTEAPNETRTQTSQP